MPAEQKHDHFVEQPCCADDVVRCTCGSLLARYVAGQIELKCRRCKRTMLLSIEDADDPALAPESPAAREQPPGDRSRGDRT